MGTKCVINVDLADVWAEAGRKKFVRTLAWGDEVTVNKQTSTSLEVESVYFNEAADSSIVPVKVAGFIEPARSSRVKVAEIVRPRSQNEVLKVNCVDVQQGDGSVIESPDGKVILVDGGDNQLFARYLAARFRSTSAAKPQEIDCVLVTHGDADHFEGLAEIFKSETHADKRKRLFIKPKRYYHNGIVKRPTTKDGKRVPDIELLGATSKVDGKTYLTGLEDNLLNVPDTEMNEPFRAWKNALSEYHKRGKITFRRLLVYTDSAIA